MLAEFLTKLDFSSVNSANSVGDTPLIYAVIWDEIEILKELINLGANLDHLGEFGSTALEHAVCDDKLEASRVLLSAGADPDLENELGFTARSLAEVSESDEVRNLLREAP